MAHFFSPLFEDDDFLALSKPAGISIDDFITGVSQQIGRKIFAFHRLDKGTSGIVLLGKRHLVAGQMSQAFEKKLIRKAYFAVVHGSWDPSCNRIENKLERGPNGRMRASPTGKNAVTTFRLLEKNDEKSWIEALPKTGRTHQIRVHCADLGYPLLDDLFYGPEQKPPESFALHAYSLNFTHPLTGQRLSLLDLPDAWRSTYLLGFDVDKVWKQIQGRVKTAD